MSGDVITFIEDLRRQEAAAKTIVNYCSDVECFARWFSGSTGKAFAAAAVTPTDIRDYRSYLQATQGAKPATVNRRLAALRRFFGWAVAAGVISENPSLSVKGVKSVPRGPRSLEKREVYKLVRAPERDATDGPGKRNLAILRTLQHTGLRVGELCDLRIPDVLISERKGSVTVRSGKGSKHRVVPLNNDARKAISAYLDVRPKVAEDHLFIGQRWDPLMPQGVELIVEKYACLAGLENVTPHVLQHSFAKQVLDTGTDQVAAARLLGRQRLDTAARYTQPTERDLERAVERLETS